MGRGLSNRKCSLPFSQLGRASSAFCWCLPFALVCAVWCTTQTSHAQSYSEQTAEQLLEQARAALTRARFGDAEHLLSELSARAELARKEGRPADADELEQRIQGYREELAARP